MRYAPYALVMMVLALGGCATIVEGTGQSIQISTSPPGAACTVDREGGRLGEIASTPGSLRVDKSKNDLLVTCTKAGFVTATVSNSPRFVGTTFGNILLGGVGGIIVDAASGANFAYPDQVMLQLAPIAPAQPAPYAPPGPPPYALPPRPPGV
jgi:hypothetical protein